MRCEKEGSLTGGTRDVNPQIFRMQMETTNTLTQQEYQIGTTILPDKKGVYVMEILKVIWEWVGTGDIQTVLTSGEIRASLCTEAPIGGTGSWGSSPFLFSKFSWNLWLQDNGGSAAGYNPNIFVYDLSDGAGHGFLVASNNLYLTVDTNDLDTPVQVDCALLYRWKKISMPDFVGLWNQWTR